MKNRHRYFVDAQGLVDPVEMLGDVMPQRWVDSPALEHLPPLAGIVSANRRVRAVDDIRWGRA